MSTNLGPNVPAKISQDLPLYVQHGLRTMLAQEQRGSDQKENKQYHRAPELDLDDILNCQKFSPSSMAAPCICMPRNHFFCLIRRIKRCLVNNVRTYHDLERCAQEANHDQVERLTLPSLSSTPQFFMAMTMEFIDYESVAHGVVPVEHPQATVFDQLSPVSHQKQLSCELDSSIIIYPQPRKT